ncbi:MAG: hypothetical protein RR585_00520 [Coprobacillus sp.]
MIVIQIFLVCVILFSAVNLAYHIYKMTELDATSRGLKKPKLWGMLSISGQNGGGLILYLIGRRKFPIDMSDENKLIMESRKKKILVCLMFMLVSSIMLIGFMVMFEQ